MIYEKCPVCEKKGWKRWRTMFFRGHKCRYCRSSITEEKRHAREPVWDPIPDPRMRRGPKAPKE